jgi:ABC-2 type transport system permease protein
MRVIDLAVKDLLQIMRDWKAAFFLVIMPLVFTLLFGFMFGGVGGQTEDQRLPVAIHDPDGGELGRALRTLVEGSPVIRPVAVESGQDLERAVTDGELTGAILVPAGYGQRAYAGEEGPLPFLVETNTQAGTAALNAVEAAVGRLHWAVETARLGTELHEQAQPFADPASRRAQYDAALRQAVAAWSAPPAGLQIRQAVAGQEASASLTNAFAQSSPGMMAQFAIAGLMAAAEVLVVERKTRALQRLLTTAIGRAEILLGHFLAMFTMITLQFALLIVFGQLFLALDYFGQPLATLLVAGSTALFAAALGLLIGALAKTEDQVVLLTLVPMFVLAGLGGAWLPLEFTSETVQRIGHASPVAWIMDGFKNILVRGQGLEAAWLPALVLLGFAAGCFGLAIWRFRFE